MLLKMQNLTLNGKYLIVRINFSIFKNKNSLKIEFKIKFQL